MKKVIQAILQVASQEKVNADITFNGKGGNLSTYGAVEISKIEGNVLDLKVYRGGESSGLVVDTHDCDLSVNQAESGKFEIAIGGVCITFRDVFKRDPFMGSANG